MKKKYCINVSSRLNKMDKEKLDTIRKENEDITIRYILEKFIEDYCSTEPKGIKIRIKEIEQEIKDIEDHINIFHENKVKLEIELKTYKDKLNKTLDIYVDENLTKAVKSIIKTYNQRNFSSFEDIPEQIFIEIAKKNKIDSDIFKNEVKKKF